MAGIPVPAKREDSAIMADSERSVHSIAIFIDFENLALGFQGRRDRFDIKRVLKRMVEKGKLVVKKAYADWNRYAVYTQALHEAAIELIEIPHRSQTGKNSADIRLCVDAMDLAYSKEHIDTFVIVSGDSDFTPLVSKLKELGKHVIGHGMQGSTSDLLRDNCDEFIYYEDLGDEIADLPDLDPTLPEQKKKAFALLMDSLQALRRENKSVLWSSMIKDTMKRKRPSFNETYHGYSSFSALLEDAERLGLIELTKNTRSGTYVVTRFGDELRHPARPAAAAERPRRRAATARSAEPQVRRAMTGISGTPVPPASRRRSSEVAVPEPASTTTVSTASRRRPEEDEIDLPLPRRRREPPEPPSLLALEAENAGRSESLDRVERLPGFDRAASDRSGSTERSSAERRVSRRLERADADEPASAALPAAAAGRRRAASSEAEADRPERPERTPRRSEVDLPPAAATTPPAAAPPEPPRSFGAGILDD